ncbi:MarR family transcriptional regulator [Streptomyces sp. RY43-2]|uniref:MarR family transcriptional regulator n=1 Tax=Streptomyces macrolidinus TaxID=2952607 RepID=A0ABT0Z8J6_9ACTN|nr:MarR family transcriptional regulator [Streptomyces macrolidinus]MCN9240078.1 MarR family transcriptional regulator [Streptomyces macrolidinus]
MREDGNGEERPVPSGEPGDGSGHGCGRDSGHGVGHGVADQEFLSLERELTVFLRRARASQGEMAREVHPDLESAAYGLLVRLDECGGQRATDLAAYVGVGKATMSRQLRALEELGLVAREPDPADGRAWLVHLTEEGSDRVGSVREARRARYVRQLSDWDRHEVAELARLIRQLNLVMEK